MRRALIPALALFTGCGQTVVWSQEYTVLDEDAWEEALGERYDNQFFCQEGQDGSTVDDCASQAVYGAKGTRKGEVCTREVAYTTDDGLEYGGHVFTFTRVDSTCAEQGYTVLCDEAAKLYGASEDCGGLTPPG